MRWLLVLLAGCAAAADAEGSTSSAVTTSSGPIPTAQLPDPQAFTGWTDEPLLVSPPRPETVAHVKIACADQKLYPTHPQSVLKLYHRYAHASYDHGKLTGDDAMCKTPSPNHRFCLAPDTFEDAVLSDTYGDSCGNLYRGFWELRFRAQDENMGTLFSRGRTVYPVPDSQFAGEVYDGGTYAVDAKDFLFVARLLPSDAATIARSRADSAKTHRLDPTTHLYEYIGPYR